MQATLAVDRVAVLFLHYKSRVALKEALKSGKQQ